MDIAYGMMARPMPLDSSRVSIVLRRRAEEMGYQTQREKQKRRLLSDYICEAVPRRWLEAVVPGFIENAGKSKEYLGEIEVFLRPSASSVWPIILASAALFKSADEALNSLCCGAETSVDLATLETPMQEQECQPLSSTLADYLGHQGTLVRSPASVLSNIGLSNMPRSGERATCQNDAIEAFYLQGRSISDSAIIGKLSVSEMEGLLRKVGENLTSALMMIAAQTAKEDAA
jgi:hypothetical protein